MLNFMLRCLQNRTKLLKYFIIFLLALCLFATMQTFITSAIAEKSSKLNHMKNRRMKFSASDEENSGSEETIDGRSGKDGESGKFHWSGSSLSLFGKTDVIKSGVLRYPFKFPDLTNLFVHNQTRTLHSELVQNENKSSTSSEEQIKKGQTLFTDSKKNIFNTEDSFLIKQLHACREVVSLQHQKLVLILIPSEPKNSLRREIIRSSWLKVTRNLTDKYVLKHLFILGKTSDSKNTKSLSWKITFDLLKLENSVYNDLLVGDFIEDYWNLTYKTMFGVTFANFYCQNADYVFKIDDDVFVRPEKFVPLLDNLPNSEFFGGNCIKKGKPHRTKKSKWYISKEEFPRVRYPPFCYGPSYAFTGDMIPYLFNATLQVNFFKLEDVYMGLCIEKAGKTVQNVAGVSNTSPKYTYCVYKDLALAHGIEPTKWSMYYRDLTKRAPQKIVCPKKVSRKSSRQLR